MSSKKCIFKAHGLDDNEDIDLSSPCFQISSEAQLRDVPTTGEEYLLKVIKERQKISTITKCNKDYSKFAKNQSCFVEELPQPSVPERLKPTIEWQNIQVADFSDVRMYISRLLSSKTTWPNDVVKIEITDNSIVGWKDFFAAKEPTLSCLFGLHHALLDRGLEVLTNIISATKPGNTISHKTGARGIPSKYLYNLLKSLGRTAVNLNEYPRLHYQVHTRFGWDRGSNMSKEGQWIYAFLACTRQPLLSDTTSILRNLARRCAEIRSRINPEDENAISAVAPLNIFICLVGRYFRQYDLAD